VRRQQADRGADDDGGHGPPGRQLRGGDDGEAGEEDEVEVEGAGHELPYGMVSVRCRLVSHPATIAPAPAGGFIRAG
jgi:hypothetical protein